MTEQRVVMVPCQYKTGRTLGRGTYAEVKEAFHITTGAAYAVKIINKNLMKGREHLIKNEILILSQISRHHRNVLTMVDFFETMNNLYLVTELAQGGELFERICQQGSFFEKDAANLVRSICEGVAYLHDNGVVHRDLKPENLLFRTKAEDSDLLIADFGLSRIIDSEKFQILTTTCGTPAYMAPEVFKKIGHGKPVDCWAIGCITYFLLCGEPPFERQNSQDELTAILNAEYVFEPLYWEGISEEAKDFITRFLTVDPTNRMTAHEALVHPWLAAPQTNVPIPSANLLPNVQRNFNARRTLHRAIDAVTLSLALGKRYKRGTVEEVLGDVKPVREDVDQVMQY
ncbi:uncharacterized protein VTP21DRAFT_6156 [Calcarisporiella thermophila]|uniref:uncharacterized protein n=1 Tax=Calcarisporiella thermophila TaxID=911321 RepID=UPI0037437B6D